MELLLSIAERLIAFLLAIFSFVTGFFTPASSYSPIDAKQIKLNAAVISDLHVAQDDLERRQIIRTGLSDINRSVIATDVLAIVGDNTNNGKPEEVRIFFEELSACKKVALTVVALGNHDSWQNDESFNAFFSEYSAFLGKTVNTPYNHFTKNGYHFFTLGTEQKMQNEAYLSDAQLQWIDAQLFAVSDTDKPVFVFIHQPFNGTNRVEEAWKPGILGEQSDRLMSILKSYTEQGMVIVCFSGHLHSGLGYSGVTNDGTLYFVDCPSYGKSPSRGDIIETGTGYVVEGYIGKLIIRARNFVTGKFYDKYTYTIETKEEPVTEEPTTTPTEPPSEPGTTEPPTEPATQPPTTVPQTTLPIEIV